MVVGTIQHILFNSDYEKNFLVQSDYLACGIVFAYVVFVEVIGPTLMKQRNAFDLYYFVILFNAALVISNAYLCFSIAKIVQEYWDKRCYLGNTIQNQKDFRPLAWQVLLLKIAELVDTIIFILRKKFNQVSFLHVFHHSIVVIFHWTVLKKNALAFYLILISAINCGVHILTYLYYGLSAIGPEVRKYLWWKKYLTIIQIVQFFFLMFYMAHSFLTGCEQFGWIEKSIFVSTVIICTLFMNFYIKAYSKTK